MEQVQMEYWEITTKKVNEFSSLNEEIEQFTDRRSQSLVNVWSSSYSKQRTCEYSW